MGYKKYILLMVFSLVFLVEIILRIIGIPDTPFNYIWKIVISFNNDSYSVIWKIVLGLLVIFLFICILWLYLRLSTICDAFERLEKNYIKLKKENAELGNVDKTILAGFNEKENRKNSTKHEEINNVSRVKSSWDIVNDDENNDYLSAKQGWAGKETTRQLSTNRPPSIEIEKTENNMKNTSNYYNKPVNTFIDENNIDFVTQKYNQVKNWNDENLFTEKYHCSWFDCQNSMARIQHSDTRPIFITNNDGSYMAVKLSGSISYYVFPRFSKAYNEASHMPGAMKEAFDSNFDSGESYDTIVVRKPAKFDCNGQTWTLKERGKLELKF